MMLLSQIIVRLNNLMKIRLHELEHDVDVSELPFGRREQDAFDLHYIRMPQEPQKLHLAEHPERVGDVFEDVVDLLDSDFLSRVRVDGCAYDPVASFADHFEDLVSVGVAVLCEKVHLFRVLVKTHSVIRTKETTLERERVTFFTWFCCIFFKFIDFNLALIDSDRYEQTQKLKISEITGVIEES